ncbi:MAG: RIP metalloprotease RseP [Neisseriaceae bacterium]|nr:MAG: RIP metalloprotease RseP [Neisseriaceae bacterium]
MLSLIGFILTISILVVIHEFGHYIAARIFNVKVLTFSVGFGPKIIKFKTKSNEWCLSAIPLGGYVKMLDERERSVPLDEQNLAYNNKPPLQKIIIAFAGPLFNFIFAIIMLSVIAFHGVPELKPIIETTHLSPLVINNSDSSISPHSQIISINNKPVKSWTDANNVFEQQLKKTSNIAFELESKNASYLVNFNFKKYIDNSDDVSLSNAGFYPFRYLDAISYIEPNSAASQAGLKIGDKIVSLNNQNIDNWFQLTEIIRANPTQKLSIQYLRESSTINGFVTPTSVTNENGQIIGKIGIMPSLDESLLKENSFTHKYGFIDGINFAFISCYSITKANLQMIAGMFSGNVSLQNLGGPVTIAQASGDAINHGLIEFAQLLAIISISIAVMNLLPIPVLDGGHILIYTLEWLIGKQINKDVQYTIFAVGFALIMFITAIAFFNDFSKLFNW